MDNLNSGSLWRKWDLHIHSKHSQEDNTKLEIKDIFQKAIENNLEVISITDHSNVNGLDEIWDYWENGKINIGDEEISIQDKISFLPGAERLLGQGDALFMDSKMSKPVRLQTPYISDQDVKNVINYIKEKV